ncbi:GlsB/YeaQ/YmgE family stress response membrane protein [Mannheimia sp. AT1]|uniref:GlsB/YeaQ/YmgE family stress response membrane protein n=1 Tax=Mannheimia cairinae TaxID=3025936 RepID=A0ABT5MRL8_9PAST|nr:GlsB/YeaQ/YmgE family stress response membrane protein [Mannheimia cairinae]MDD0824824.1 GlsB/YeaQ/YmgE family stress response membrane protein [Mannheimia cairinae]MDD0826246.1 GlsB/YeaQ/YmgE family stress response membrane protein [Mannheimia cairinae]
MEWIAAIIIGGLIGWLASIAMKSNTGLCLNIIIGIIGSSLGRWVFGDLMGIGSAYAAGQFNVIGIFFGVLGAIILIFILRKLKLVS